MTKSSSIDQAASDVLQRNQLAIEHPFTIDADNVVKMLSSSEEGLLVEEAQRRIALIGKNVLPEDAKKPKWRIAIEQLKSPLVYVLLVAAAISYGLGEHVDAVVILAAVAIQAIVGFIQEYKAQQSLAALKKVISLDARIVRMIAGKSTELVIEASEVVPGDIILLQAGDKIPADVRLFSVDSFEVNEAALTGESEPINKHTVAIADVDTATGDRTNMAYTGTVATKGSAQGIVVATGTNTEIGKIASLIHETEEEATPLQKQLTSFAKKISIVIVAIAIAIMLFGYLTGGNLVEMFTVAVAVAVSAIPEGLAIAVTITLAVGMQHILKRKALVRKLVAAETLGSTDVICTDKTGTLTEGNMQVTDIVTWDHAFSFDAQVKSQDLHKDIAFAVRAGLLCNDAKVNNPDEPVSEWVVAGNLTERALVLAAAQLDLHKSDVEKEAVRIDTIPFDSSIKYMATLHREAQGRMLYVKGAPEIVAEKCTSILIDGKEQSLTPEVRNEFNTKFVELSNRGLRIIAIAYKNSGANAKTIEQAKVDNLVLMGYVGIKDPLRVEAKQTIATCRKAGIRTVMITGDHVLTASAIARELGLEHSEKNILQGKELDSLSDEALQQRVEDIHVYARVTPEHKIRIVKAWQAKDKVVAMTGDGINDSPAIKAADIGVALGSGTDVAKETADMVLLDNNFATIVSAVEEGRNIFDNIKKTTLFLLSDSMAEVVIVIVALLLGLPIPITAAQILWINIVKDSFPGLAMTQEPKDPSSMLQRPRGKHASIFNTESFTLITVASLTTGLLAFLRFYVALVISNDIDIARTVAFASLALDSLLYMFSIRSVRKFFWQQNPFNNMWLIGALFMGLFLQVIAIYSPWLQPFLNTAPIDWNYWLLAVSFSFIIILVIDFVKGMFIWLVPEASKTTD